MPSHGGALAFLSGRKIPGLAVTVVVACASIPLAAQPIITNVPVPQTVFLGDDATFRVGAGGVGPIGYQWFRNGTPVNGATGSTLAFTTAAADHNAQFSVQVTNATGAVTSAPAVLRIDFGIPGPAQTNRWIEVANLWRYNVDKTNLPSTWPAPAWPDSGWPVGGGLLYVEESTLPAPKTTALPLTAGSLPTTCYFRTRFTNNLVNPYSVSLVVNTVVDDGLVVYLNGAAGWRLGVADGVPTYSTLANRSVGNAAWEGPFDFPVTNLWAGTNVLAAEVHQYTTNSTDIVMGLTLDAVWQPRWRDSNAPVVASLLPAAGSTLSALTQIEVQFSEEVYGVDAADLRINGKAATNLTAIGPGDYVFAFPSPAPGPVSVTWAPGHGITDRSASSNAFVGTGFGYVLGSVSAATALSFSRVIQSTDASTANRALQAVDGTTSTFSLTANLPGSYWLGEFARPYPLERIELVNRSTPADSEMAGLKLRLYNLDDQVVFETGLTNPGSSGSLILNLPPGLAARSLWIGLPGTQSNGGGNFRVGLAEVRVYGVPNIPFGPAPVVVSTNTVRVWQSSEYGGYPASNATDGNTGNFTHTGNYANSYWMADFGRAATLDRIEIVNRNSCCDNRLAGLVLRLYDGSSNSIASAVLTNPGLGGTWTHTPTAGTVARWIRVGLENGQTNGGGNYYVTLAEARAYSGGTNLLLAPGSEPVPVTNNLASFKRSYMVRLSQSIPAATNANDDKYSTETATTSQTVDGYWEVDLGATYALYAVRTIAASGIGYRLTNTVVRLYDEAHESVFARKVAGTPDAFDTDLNGPIFARYVRVGLENKQRTDPAGGLEWYIGMREVEVFGRPTNQVGVLSFTASTNQVMAGQPVTLSWTVADMRRVEIHPGLGSVGSLTATSGVGSVTLTPTQSAEYILIATNDTGLFARAVGVGVGTSTLPIRLSELVADNQFSLKDGYGEASDWIELRNTGNAAVNLAGYGLSDNPAQPMKWLFPATNLAPHSTLIVFASGRDSARDPAGNLQANFKLDSAGGSLRLTAPDGLTTIDSLDAYPALDTDLAYGRDLEGNWTMMEPTPGAVNTGRAYAGWLKPLDWSHARGYYQAPFTLTLTNRNAAGASVLVSVDGSVPAVPYTNGIAVSGTKVIRAQVVRAGYRSPRIQTKTFIFVDDVVTSSVMNTAITQAPAYASRMKPGLLALPAIALTVPGTPTYDEQEGSIEVLWPGSGDPVQANCGIYQFGGSWQTFPKKSFTVAFRARYGTGKLHAPLFDGFDHGVVVKSSFDKLELGAGNQDMSARGFYMADRFVQDSLLDMGSLNPHGRFVHVYLNGVYWGQYNCKEVLMENFLADYLGGTPDDYVSVKGNDNMGDSFVLGTPDAPNTQPWERVLSLLNSFTGVRPYLDVPHLVDFMLLWNYGNAESEFRACGPREAGSGFKFWMNDADGFLRTSALGMNRLGNTGPGGLFGGLVTEGNTDFKTLLADRIYRHFLNRGALTPAANDARLAARMLEIHDSLLAECARWGYQTPASWESAAASIRSNLFPTRTTQLLGYLRTAGLYPAFDPPTFSPYGGLVATGFQPVLSSASGTIYYTLDGSDPRLAGGGISSSARIWTAGAVTITNDLTLNARVRTSGGSWSALAQPTFLLASRRAPTSRDLLVTEVNYNPAGADDYEFIELYNAGTNLLDLSGVTLSNAVRYVFPNSFALLPGASVVIAKNTNLLAQRYQAPASPWYFSPINLVGPWSGSLDNGGETLTLLASNGVELCSIPYKPSGDWPERADGQGSSLELASLPAAAAADADVKAFLANGRNWTSSALYHGSPGRLAPYSKTVRISELLSHTDLGLDWLELWNLGNQPEDLTGCSLTDNMDAPAAWCFPTNTVLAPGQFLVISSAQLGFAFGENGERAFLLRLAGTNVLRFLDSVDFPAADREESFGLYQRTDGEFDFTEQRVNTPGTNNALPRVGPVVISEILSSPLPGLASFIELTSLTNQPLALYDPLWPTNVWTIEGIGSFAFPTGVVLEGCSSIIVCSTNPAVFRTQYALPASVPVFGPWSGTLDPDGETLKLLRPGEPELDGSVPYYRVDHVTYRVQAPWPTAQIGRSLERLPVQAYGNDPASWCAGPTNGTPGLAAANRPPMIHVDGNLTGPELAPLALTVSVADPDAPWQTASLQPTRLPPGGSFEAASGLLTWTPSEAQGPGSYQVEFVATDDVVCGALSTTLPFSISVEESNQPPLWVPQADVWWPASVPCSIPLTVSDADLPAQALSFQALGLPAGISLETSPLRLAGTASIPGDYPIELTVSDGQAPPLTATLPFTIHFTDPRAVGARIDSGRIELSFVAAPGETYYVEWCEDLALNQWHVLQGPTVAQAYFLTATDPSPDSVRFYRVRWVR